MRMTGEQRIAAPRAKVWEALNDPEILRQSIPGCQSLDKESDERLRGIVEIKIGPIGARFNGIVTLSDVDPAKGYTITGEGQGGTVGSAKGGAKVRLADDNGGTLLSYDVDAQVGGRLAQLGGPIIDATAKRLAAQFFTRFGEIVAGGAMPVPARADVVSAVAPSPPGRSPASMAWLLALVVGAAGGFAIGHAHDEWLHIGLLVLIVGALAFLLGRRSGGAGL